MINVISYVNTQKYMDGCPDSFHVIIRLNHVLPASVDSINPFINLSIYN